MTKAELPVKYADDIEALRKIVEAMLTLDDEGRRCILVYINARFAGGERR